MPRPYNKKTVRDAIYLLDIYASMPMCGFDAAARAAEVRPSSTGYRVAEKLIGFVADVMPEEIIAVVAGEAAGLLREGWRIGDPIPVPMKKPVVSENDTVSIPSDTFFDVERTTDPNPPFAGDNVFERVYPVAEVLAEPLDAVEEPTDEEIAHAFDDDPDPVTTEYVDNSADYETTEPSE